METTTLKRHTGALLVVAGVALIGLTLFSGVASAASDRSKNRHLAENDRPAWSHQNKQVANDTAWQDFDGRMRAFLRENGITTDLPQSFWNHLRFAFNKRQQQQDQPGTDSVAPVISDLRVFSITGSTATVSWHTNESADGHLYFGTSSPVPYTASDPSRDTPYGTTHQIALSGLTPSTTYYYRVVAHDAVGNPGMSDEESFHTLSATGGTTTPPPATGTSTATTTATMSTTATQFATTLLGVNETPPVSTGTTGSFTGSFDRTNDSATFALSVTNGTGITAAHLHCGAAGVAGPIVVPLQSTPAGVSVNGSYATGTIRDADVANATASAATSSCAYGMNTVDKLLAAAQSGTIYVNVHSVAYPAGLIRGQLTPGTGTTGTTTATTTDTTAPIISGISLTGTTGTGTTVRFTTNESATGEVFVGTTAAVSTASTFSFTHPGSVTGLHTVPVTGLSPTTTYYALIRATDVVGNPATSSIFSFTTGAGP